MHEDTIHKADSARVHLAVRMLSWGLRGVGIDVGLGFERRRAAAPLPHGPDAMSSAPAVLPSAILRDGDASIGKLALSGDGEDAGRKEAPAPHFDVILEVSH